MKKNKIKVKKIYLIDIRKYKGIYYEIFFSIRKHKVILFPKFKKNGLVSITSTLTPTTCTS
jgi:hypothetical protein